VEKEEAMIYAHDLKDWVRTLDDDDEVSIDEDGLSLVVPGVCHLEVGGEPEDEGNVETEA
jgi:hypothetical protein